jgi:hypothetical protein
MAIFTSIFIGDEGCGEDDDGDLAAAASRRQRRGDLSQRALNGANEEAGQGQRCEILWIGISVTSCSY